MKKIIATAAAVLVALLIAVVLWQSQAPKQHSSMELVGTAITPVYSLPARIEDHRAQQRLHPTEFGNIAYLDIGEGDVLLLLHGVPTSSWMYRKLIPELQSTHRVIAVDLLGYGSSGKPEKPAAAYTAENQAKAVQSLLDALKIESYSILMHDMGSLVAWELLQQDSHISNLVVMNSIVRNEGFNNPSFEPGVMTKMITDAYSSSATSQKMLSSTFAELGLSTSNQLSEEECRGYILPMVEGGKFALYEFFTSLNQELFDKLEANKAVFKEFEGESLVLWGAKDTILTDAQIPYLQEHLRIPEQNIHIFPDNNHFLAEEIPTLIAPLIAEFLSGDG